MSFPKHQVTAGAVIYNDQNQIVLIRNPKRGWELPGGHIEEKENIKNALIREIKEETGLDIEISKFCGISQEVSKSIINTWWTGTVIGGEFCTSIESIEVDYFEKEEAINQIEKEEFKIEIEHVINTELHPFVIIFN